MKHSAYSSKLLTIEVLTLLLALLFLVPFYFLFVNSFKTFAELLTNTASLPTKLNWDNYIRAWNVLHFPRALSNSIIITISSVSSMVIIASMAAYRLARRSNRMNRALFTLFITAMVVPFQAIMIPLVKVGNWLHFLNSFYGIVLCYAGLGVSFSLFLYHGFIKSIPPEIEESAVVDGCNPYAVFWRIIFPLLKPMTVTVIVLQSLWIWNDFLLPLLVLQDKGLQTVQLATNALFGQYTKQWDLALAALVMGIVPILLFFLFMQRHIMEGITAGAVKG
ncbi:carbohydrate ABC transporter permease [Paenibacillus sp. SYP-B3998]|uniref:Carbohydrate ABC transporter permease n=1 Tax=Paenibacillus sp. SYP-B3998 TaxID=2678564 RepID=A0A6G3ZXN2_9BACL|nr:carbohydrate ABC transporter permease [Paenibacillus sp. SYP-B3998]NEW06976.1 carbohydrate ABC transporter permease [Paenibacillus sp. SYP-B3998]